MRNHWLQKKENRGSLYRLANEPMDLNLYYAYQFVQNDKYADNRGDNRSSYYQLDYTPILKGSMTGTIYVGGQAVQTFIQTENGELAFAHIGKHEVFALQRSHLDCETGKLIIAWSKKPGSNYVILNYEYDWAQEAKAPMHQTILPGSYHGFPTDDPNSMIQYG